ncbi:hypothetical protein IWZ01DRAFT_543815 [Phyllosticta capitalensis]
MVRDHSPEAIRQRSARARAAIRGMTLEESARKDSEDAYLRQLYRGYQDVPRPRVNSGRRVRFANNLTTDINSNKAMRSRPFSLLTVLSAVRDYVLLLAWAPVLVLTFLFFVLWTLFLLLKACHCRLFHPECRRRQ